MIVLVAKFYYCAVQITMELVLTTMPIFFFISNIFAFVFLHLSFQACVFAFSTTDHSSLLAVRKWRKKVRRPPCWRSLAPRTTKITQKMTCMPYWFFKTMDKKVMGWGGDRVMPKGCSQPELTLSVLLVLMIFPQLLLSCSSCRWCWYWCWCYADDF